MQGWVHVLAIGGAAGELAALIWGALAAVRGAHPTIRRMRDYIRTRVEHDLAREAHDRGEYAFVTGDEVADAREMNAIFDLRLTRALGRPRTAWSDPELVPEYAALAVLHDRLHAIAWPAALLTFSCAASALGAVLSLA